MSTDRHGAPSSEFLEAVIQHVAHPIFVKDTNHTWIWVNDAFAALVGLPREELIGKTDSDFFPKDQADFFYAKDREVFEGRVIEIESTRGDVPLDIDGEAPGTLPARMSVLPGAVRVLRAT